MNWIKDTTAFASKAKHCLNSDIDSNASAPVRNDDLNKRRQMQAKRGSVRLAAVLVPIIQRSDAMQILLTRRRDDLPDHSGQIAFPGGKVDANDASPLAAALRETREEVGITSEYITPLGYLDSYLTGTGFNIIPVVAMVHEGFTLEPEISEVAEIFEVPLQFLMNPENHHIHTKTIDQIEWDYYAMPYGDHYIWGATAGIIHNLYLRMSKNV